MQINELPQEKQPDAVSDQLVRAAPSLWLYIFLIAIAALLIVISFSMRVDWPGLLLNLAASLIAAIVLLILVDRRLRASEVGQIRRFPQELGLRSLLLVSPRHRHLHSYARAFLSVLDTTLRSKVVPHTLQDLAHRHQQSFILFGAPGAGKTTRLQMLAAHWTREFLKHQIPSVPILFPLRLWSGDQPLLDALSQHVEGFAPIRRESILRTLQQGKAIVMFDGADELSAEGVKKFLSEFANIRAAYRLATWIVSTRPAMFREIDLPRVELPALTPDDIRRIGAKVSVAST